MKHHETYHRGIAPFLLPNERIKYVVHSTRRLGRLASVCWVALQIIGYVLIGMSFSGVLTQSRFYFFAVGLVWLVCLAIATGVVKKAPLVVMTDRRLLFAKLSPWRLGRIVGVDKEFSTGALAEGTCSADSDGYDFDFWDSRTTLRLRISRYPEYIVAAEKIVEELNAVKKSSGQ